MKRMACKARRAARLCLTVALCWLAPVSAWAADTQALLKDPMEAGRQLLAAGDLAGARERFEEALRLLPGDPVVLNNLATVRAAQGDYRAALDILASAQAAAPGRADINENLNRLRSWVAQHQGVALESPGQYDDALPEEAATRPVPALWPQAGGNDWAPRRVPAAALGPGESVVTDLSGRPD